MNDIKEMLKKAFKQTKATIEDVEEVSKASYITATSSLSLVLSIFVNKKIVTEDEIAEIMTEKNMKPIRDQAEKQWEELNKQWEKDAEEEVKGKEVKDG